MIQAEPLAHPDPGVDEATLRFDDLFYTRTDRHGMLQAGNEAFGRVVEYGWDRLLGAPHRILRHPDMPRAMFWLLWDRIRQGLPTGVYIKNRTRNGRVYWVFALVAPVGNSEVSVRIRPASGVFGRCRDIYRQALARETAGLDPRASAEAMLGELCRDGFAGYEEFMGVALFSEIRARCAAVGKRPPERLTLIAELHGLLREALHRKQALLGAFDEIRLVPTNLHIVASRLESYGGPVSTIAENYRLMSSEVTRRLEELTGPDSRTAPCDRLQMTVAEGLFLTGATLLFTEARDSWRTDPAAPGIDSATETALLDGLDRAFRARAVTCLGTVARAAVHLAARCQDLKRQMLGLDSIRVLCRVEAGRLPEDSEGLQAIIATLDRFHSRGAVQLDGILALARQIVALTQTATKADP
ncbi:PAS domain-containing protein [Frigidibacter sp. ROC022]|uniref:PAS domain-containing protein n=1 Tax=Frigidibacter sp. ROC022 TaxID=2971796 RepID=UPI00215ACA03|nr:PAS domain-containing protein [Frigidibacter sp. ROC022]MCR8724906.1 PAS domain-containing protein [Frigidibacter sp. ROC022]